MTDIADEIRKALATPATGDTNPAREAGFRKLRAAVRGSIIGAHHFMVADNLHGWTDVDDRILDVVTNWLESLRDRG